MATLNPTQVYWLQLEAQYAPNKLTDQQMFRNLLEEVVGYATGKLDLCEVSHILSEVAEEFEEEAAS